MSYLRRIRGFLDLRQADVERATGIPVGRLSAAENGKIRLTAPEEAILREFLAARMKVVAEVDGGADLDGQVAALVN
jgi:transcriptional regulator with XRE-family HTH domain